MAADAREYECIVFGATGYTGKYTAEHITSQLPTDFRWAVAGRNESKLKALVDTLRSLNPDRTQPSIEISRLDKSDLVKLAKKTKVLITTVGPYHKYGTVVLEACAETGTHYLDVTGEVPWVSEMIQKYHDVANKTNAILIPQNGVESAPTDLICWKLVSDIRDKLGVGTSEVVHTIYDIKAGASGGTLATALGIFEEYSPSQLMKAQNPWGLCPISPPQQTNTKSYVEKITGVRSVSGLGTLTDSLQGPADIPIVHRSWGLYGGNKFYGPEFHLSAYMRARNAFTGFLVHIAFMIVLPALLFAPFRWLVRQFVYAPGEGPSKEQASAEYVEWRAIANADVAASDGPKQAYGRMRWNGSMYQFTGVCLAESALILAREKTYANDIGGGILTPATLGTKYLEGLQRAGLQTEFKMF